MNGQMLSGTVLMEAVKYQLLIMFPIAGSAGFRTVTAVWMVARHLLDERRRLQPDRLNIPENQGNNFDESVKSLKFCFIPIPHWFDTVRFDNFQKVVKSYTGTDGIRSMANRYYAIPGQVGIHYFEIVMNSGPIRSDGADDFLRNYQISKGEGMEKKDDILSDLPAPWNYLIPLATRFAVWAILASLLYILRSFFLLLFLTFVFAYIQSGSVNRLGKYIRSRGLRVITVFVLLLTFLTAVGLFVFPKVRKQTESFVSQFSVYIKKVDETIANLAARYPFLYNVIPELRDPELSNGQPLQENGKGEQIEKKGKSPTIAFLQELMGLGEFAEGNTKKIDQVLSILGGIGGRFASVSSAFLLSLLFSFLIVFDLPRLSRNVTDLKNTKLRFIYDEVAENIFNFSQVLGQALEVQFYISLINTVLTAIGIYILGMGTNVAFLSVIVFFCSFIPVAGVFVSSVPICLIALQTSGGLQTLFLAILLIIIVHLLEGYVLNPKIYGARMRINPVIVLIILTISGKLFHFWGLILGVPICTYFFGHAIRHTSPDTEKGVVGQTG